MQTDYLFTEVFALLKVVCENIDVSVFGCYMYVCILKSMSFHLYLINTLHIYLASVCLLKVL